MYNKAMKMLCLIFLMIFCLKWTILEGWFFQAETWKFNLYSSLSKRNIDHLAGTLTRRTGSDFWEFWFYLIYQETNRILGRLFKWLTSKEHSKQLAGQWEFKGLCGPFYHIPAEWSLEEAKSMQDVQEGRRHCTWWMRTLNTKDHVSC